MTAARMIAFLALALGVLFLRTANAQTDATRIVYINGIQNTLEDAQETLVKIEDVLLASPNHQPAESRRDFDVYLVWNPIGWYGTESGWDSLQDLMELFALKTAEEHFAADFVKLLAPHNQPAVIDSSAASNVAKYLDDMTPGDNSLEDGHALNGEIDDARISRTKAATLTLIALIKSLRSAVVVAHSQGNLLANLAWAKLARESGNDVRRMMRVVNVANTSMFSVNNLNFTHAADAALFSRATMTRASLETLPSWSGWRRTTPGIYGCPNNGTCNFVLAGATFGEMSTEIDYPTSLEGTADAVLHHSIVLTYLSTAIVPLVDSQGVRFTPGAERFVDRFEDFVYAAAESLEAVAIPPSIASGGQPQNTTVTVGQAAAFTAVATGTAPLSFQWRRNGISIPNATSPIYSVDAVNLSDDGSLFSVVVSNGFGSISSAEARLTVSTSPPPPFEALTWKGRVATCERCSIAVRANGTVSVAGIQVNLTTSPYPAVLGVPAFEPGPWVEVPTLGDIVQVSTRVGHSLALRSDGSVFATGSDEYGNLGMGGQSRSDWTRVSALANVRQIATGSASSYAVTMDGALWIAGANTFGQVGLDPPPGNVFHLSWTRVPNMSNVKMVAAGDVHALVLKNDGTVWGAGLNNNGNEGRLGLGTLSQAREWTQIPGLANVVDIAAGVHHSLALTANGRILATGSLLTNSASAYGMPPRTTFGEVPGITSVKAIAAGPNSSFAITDGGVLWVAGVNDSSSLGLGQTAPYIVTNWARVSGLDGVEAVASDGSHSIAIKVDGSLWAAGKNFDGANGLGKPGPLSSTPQIEYVWRQVPGRAGY